MADGVGKSGSPAPKPMTGRPAALRAFAFASTASVADSAIPPTRAEMRRSVAAGSGAVGPAGPAPLLRVSDEDDVTDAMSRHSGRRARRSRRRVRPDRPARVRRAGAGALLVPGGAYHGSPGRFVRRSRALDAVPGTTPVRPGVLPGRPQ